MSRYGFHFCSLSLTGESCSLIWLQTLLCFMDDYRRPNFFHQLKQTHQNSQQQKCSTAQKNQAFSALPHIILREGKWFQDQDSQKIISIEANTIQRQYQTGNFKADNSDGSSSADPSVKQNIPYSPPEEEGSSRILPMAHPETCCLGTSNPRSRSKCHCYGYGQNNAVLALEAKEVPQLLILHDRRKGRRGRQGQKEPDSKYRYCEDGGISN